MWRRTLFTAGICTAALTPAAHAALPAGNLLSNPGAEAPTVGSFSDFPYQPIPGWSQGQSPGRMRAMDEIADGESGDFIHAGSRSDAMGCRMFAGPGNPGDSETAPPDDGEAELYAYQDVSLAGLDPGQKLRYGADLFKYSEFGHANNDYAAVQLQFYNAGNAPTGPLYSKDNSAEPQPTGANHLSVDEGNITPPGDATTATIFVVSHPTGLDVSHPSPANGTVDNVYLTADGTIPAAPPAGCQAPAVTTGNATAIGRETAHIDGTLDPHGEYTQWSLRYSTDPNGSGLTAAGTFDVTTAGPVSADLVGLNQASTYYYWLEAVSYQSGPNEPYGTSKGQVKSFTTLSPPPAPPPPPPVVRPPVVLGPFKPTLTVEKQKIRKVIVSGWEVKLKWSTNHLAKTKWTMFVYLGKKKTKMASFTDQGFYGGGSGLTRAPKGKVLKFLRRARKAKFRVEYSSTTREGVTVKGAKTLTLKR